MIAVLLMQYWYFYNGTCLKKVSRIVDIGTILKIYCGSVVFDDST